MLLRNAAERNAFLRDFERASAAVIATDSMEATLRSAGGASDETCEDLKKRHEASIH